MEEEYKEEAYSGDIWGEVELLDHYDDEYEEEVELGGWRRRWRGCNKC